MVENKEEMLREIRVEVPKDLEVEVPADLELSAEEEKSIASAAENASIELPERKAAMKVVASKVKVIGKIIAKIKHKVVS